MVTAKYLLRGREEWLARLEALQIFDQILACVHAADVRALGQLDDAELGRPSEADHPLGDQRVHRVDHPRGPRGPGRRTSGGSSCSAACRGAGWPFSSPPSPRRVSGPDRRDHEARQVVARRRPPVRDGAGRLRLPHQPPAARSPRSIRAQAMMPPPYYTLQVPRMIAAGTASLPYHRRADVDHFANRCPETGELLACFPHDHQSSLPGHAVRRRRSRGRVGRGGGPDPPRQRLRPRPARTVARRPPARPDRTGSQPAAGRPGHSRRRRLRADPARKPVPLERDRRWRIGPEAGRGRRRDARRRRRQPLDDRRRRRQGRQSVRRPRRPPPQLPGNPSRQDPQGSSASSRPRSPTS